MELKVLEKFLPTLRQNDDVVIGPGDDCAAVRRSDGSLLLLAVDQLISGVHYRDDLTTPEEAGAKLVKRNCSDIAAMGGVPAWAMLAYAAGSRSEEEVLRFLAGVRDACEKYEISLLGGDFATLPGAWPKGEVTSLSIGGSVPAGEVVTRSGATAGDLLYVTGELGNSFDSQHHVRFIPRLAEGRFLAARHLASAMLDVSDGLLLDAKRLGRMSRVGIRLELRSLPLRSGATVGGALADGEDYELLFTVPPERAAELEQVWPQAGLARPARIGEVFAGEGVLDFDGNDLLKEYKNGYEH